jgi:hypothetical protein
VKILQHLSALAITTIVMAVIYLGIQQTYRSGANDPQMEMLSTAKEHMQTGRAIELFAHDTIDLQKSPGVFIETFDAAGKPLQSTGYLDGKLPQIPRGVLDHAKTDGENWISWQPQADVRMALGVAHVNANPVSYIAVGRSLKEVEKRIANMSMIVLIGWLLCIVLILVNASVQYFQNRKTKLA